MIQVSLLVPCYNSQEFIRELVSQAKEQTVKFSEIILFDDSSGDNTRQVIRGIEGVKVICSDVNLGAAEARNRLLEVSSCPYVHFHDSDDPFSSKEFLAQMISQFQEGAVNFCAWKSVNQDGSLELFKERYHDVGNWASFFTLHDKN